MHAYSIAYDEFMTLLGNCKTECEFGLVSNVPNEEALTAYEQVIHLLPQYADAYRYKGVSLTHLKRYEEALATYEQAISLYDTKDWEAIYDCAETYNDKGDVLQSINRYEEALAAYEQAIKLNSFPISLYYRNKGRVLELLAQQAYKKAEEIELEEHEEHPF